MKHLYTSIPSQTSFFSFVELRNVYLQFEVLDEESHSVQTFLTDPDMLKKLIFFTFPIPLC